MTLPHAPSTKLCLHAQDAAPSANERTYSWLFVFFPSLYGPPAAGRSSIFAVGRRRKTICGGRNRLVPVCKTTAALILLRLAGRPISIVIALTEMIRTPIREGEGEGGASVALRVQYLCSLGGVQVRENQKLQRILF